MSQHSSGLDAAVEDRPASGYRAPNAIADDAILDAVADLVCTVGLRRITMADIARHASVSRATLYRRWRSVDDTLAALLTREWTAMAATAGRAAGDNARERLVNAVVGLVAASREHALLRALVDSDPQFLMPYLLHRPGRTTDHQLALLADFLDEGVTDGSIRASGDGPQAMARAVLVTAWSFVFTGRALTDDTAELDRELTAMLEAYLRP